MKRCITIVSVVLVSVIVSIVTLGACFGTLLVWRLHPWVREGQAFELGRWQFGELEFQAWQRKTDSIFEPFADGLFVKRGTNQWNVFCFDIQDRYSPKVRLQKENSQIVVYRDGEKRGEFDLETQTFRRHGQVYPPSNVDGSNGPPGDWWLRR